MRFHVDTYIFSCLAIPYRVLIFPRQKTSANCWFSLAGQLGETPHVSIAKHTLDYVYEVSKAKLHRWYLDLHRAVDSSLSIRYPLILIVSFVYFTLHKYKYLNCLFKHKNLGILTTLRIGHDNAGMSPKWMVEHILVRNECTGQTYRWEVKPFATTLVQRAF